MIDIKKYELSTTGICAPVVVATWGGIKGNIEDQQDLVEYVSSHGGGDAVWGSITGNIKDQTDLYDSIEGIYDWVRLQGYITSSDLSGYATESWVSSQNYLTSTALTGYATESWVGSQGYITTSALSGYATESWVQNQGYYQQLPGYYAIEKRILSMDPDTEDKPEDYPIDEYVDYDYLTIGYCDTGETWRFDGVRLGEEGAGIYTITPVETEVEGETVIEYQEDYDSFVTQSYLLPIEDDLGDITVRVTALETNYGDAVTTTNNILGV